MEEHEPNWKNMVFYGVAWFIACLLLVLALINTVRIDQYCAGLDYEWHQ